MDTNNSLHKLSEVASRIKELRDIMGWSVAEMAEKTDVSEDIYVSYESGKIDIPFSFIHKCALAFDVELTELLEGNTAKLSSYTITRKGKGQGTAKENGIDIANLAPKFKDKLAEPYWVKYEYSASQQNKPIKLKIEDLRNENLEEIETANHAMMNFSFKNENIFKKGSIIRKEVQ